MKSSEFLVEGDDKNMNDVQVNHPEVYKFLLNLAGRLALEKQSKVETVNTASSHMVIISIQPTAGLSNTRAALENEGIPYEYIVSAGAGEILSGSFNDIEWNVSDDGRRGNITETWRFAVPYDDGDKAVYHDRTMD